MGRMLNETLGKWNFWLLFIGFNLTFFPMHILGLHGMTRRIYTYVAETGWGNLNLLATIGAATMGVAVVIFGINVLWSRKRGEVAVANPWKASTLECAIPSPPPAYNYYWPPAVDGHTPLWGEPEKLPVVTGLSLKKREVLSTTIIDAKPEHRYELAIDSIWPLVLAIVVTGSFTALIFTPWAIPIGAFLSMIVLYIWFWRGTEPGLVEEAGTAEHGAPGNLKEKIA